MNVKATLHRIWNSPTIMTWMSYGTKSASLVLVTPLILTRFNEQEIVIWYAFVAILSMSGLADLGFRNAFVRFFSFANGGAKTIGVIKNGEKTDGKTNWELIGKLYSHMTKIYITLSFLVLIGMLIGGYFGLKELLRGYEHADSLWTSWIVLSVATSLDFYGKTYYNYLEGLNEVALVKRVEAIFKLFVIFGFFGVLMISPSIFGLTIVVSAGYVATVTRNYILARNIREKKLRTIKNHPLDKAFLKEIWKPAWRSGVSGLVATGLTNLTGILYAQVGSHASAASYMVTMRILNEIKNVANAPFYSKIPILAKLNAEGNQKRLIELAQDGMRKSHIFFVFSVIMAGLCFGPFLEYIDSDVKPVSTLLWLMMAFAFYAHRYGAMHVQIYQTSNDIISHIADTINAVIFALVAFFLFPYIELYAIPLGMLVGYLFFYSWYSTSHSLKFVNMTFFQFEKKTSLPVMLVFLIYAIFALFFG
ncbi:MAG: hypothetical protein EP338_11015 [Bacteroidetes bacterium]|nr:MAG: hypothetical protein EP338_11015 [Bacteroidota bacterium]